MSAPVALDIAALTEGWTQPARPWLDEPVVRERAIHTAAAGTTRELWKYTPLPAMAAAFQQLSTTSSAAWTGLEQPGVRALPFSALPADDLAMIHGILEGGLDASRHLLADLTLLRAADGILVEVSGQPAEPITLAHAAGGASLIVLVVREQADVALVEQLHANDFAAQVILADVARGATLRHHRTAFAAKSGLWSLTQVRVHDRATYTLDQHADGSGRCRLENHVILAGRGASTQLTGAYLVGDDEHLEQQLVVEHEAADTTSRQRFHGIGNGRGRSVFNGRIHIHPRAARSDAWLSNRNLALHPDADMNTKPELEIYNDDVRCAHGATVGQLAADSLFFLTARGIPKPAARTMLAHAFLRECIAGPLAETATARLLDRIR